MGTMTAWALVTLRSRSVSCLSDLKKKNTHTHIWLCFGGFMLNFLLN